jgi:hypothetical protein
LFILSALILLLNTLAGQVRDSGDEKILFRGLVMDASTFSPVINSQIMINRVFTGLSGADGTFSFYVNRKDTVAFRSLGYKQSFMFISDTLRGQEFVAGIFLNSDTVSIGEVVILPGYRNLKSDILNAKPIEPANMSNARYNIAVSAYQGKNSTAVLGDPIENYAVINQRQKTDAFEKGGIPSNSMVGLNALMMIPAAYMLLKEKPAGPPPMEIRLSDKEIEQVRARYLEIVRNRK